MSFDTETSISSSIHSSTFRDPNNDIYTVITANNPNDVHVEHRKEGFNQQLPALAVEKLKDAQVIVGHNLSFDLCYIWQTIEIKEFILKGGKIWDTQLAEYLLTGQQHCFASLAELQEKYLGERIKPSRIGLLYKKGIGADKILAKQDQCPRLFSLYEHYCKMDGATPLLILKKQYEIAKADGMIEIIELYNDYLLSIINMTVTGIQIDVTQTEKTLTEFNIKHLEYLEQAQEILKKYWTDPRLPIFNINSPDHKSAVLFGGAITVSEMQEVGHFKNGNVRYKKTPVSIQVEGFGVNPCLSIPSKKEGLYSTDDSVMKRIAEETTSYELQEYCRLQKQAMMYKKAAKTYCQAFIDLNVDGKIHANYNNTLTATSRLSSNSPNLQNISKRNEFGAILHRLFIAPPGWKCVSIDFSQLEIWVLAWLSKDEKLTQDLLKGVDLHIVRLQYVFPEKTYEELYQLCKGENKEEYWEKQRGNAKTLSYQKAYGAQAKKIAESTGMDLETVELIMQKEDEMYTGAAALTKRVQESIKNTATISKAADIPASQKKGKAGSRIVNDVEMLPIFDKSGDVSYTDKDVRQVGYWKSPTGKKYSFMDSGRYYKGQLKRGFSFTQPKNYPMQGSASDIQAITSAALLKALISKPDVIKMVNEVHDSKWMYIKEDKLDVVLKWLKETIENVPNLMKDRFGIDVPLKFPIDISVGPNFSDMETYYFNNTEETICKRQ